MSLAQILVSHAVLLASSLALAAVVPRMVTELGQADISSFTPYTLFAAVGYCSPTQTSSWSCGEKCSALAGFEVVNSGGDGVVEQFWFVGFYQPLNSVLVVHQGTNPHELTPLATDADAFLVPLNASAFPGVPAGVYVHRGFLGAHELSSLNVLNAVLIALARHPSATVAFSSHSLGAAIGMLDAVFLRSRIPASTPFKFVGYGTPRVGNAAFASWVDSILPTTLTRVNNGQDPVPIIPGRFFGYHHPCGEVHITATNDGEPARWLACSGQDSVEVGCIDGSEASLFASRLADHDGPYNGIYMGCA